MQIQPYMNPGNDASNVRLGKTRMHGYNFDPKVFQIEDPRCDKCRTGILDFRMFENLDDSGMDWIQWFCTNDHCGHYFSVEIL